MFRLAAAALFGIGLLLLTTGHAWSISPVATLSVTAPDGTTPLAGGGSATEFTLVPPANSHCTKDTSTGHYTSTTYIVPAATDPATLTWAAGIPSTGTQLLDGTGAALGPFNTAIGSGNIQSLPALNFALFSVDGSGGNANPLPVGDYNVGIACVTDTSATDVFWNVVLTFTTSASDPNGEVWQVHASSGGATTTTTGSTTTTSTTTGSGSSTTSTTGSTTGSTTTSTTDPGSSTTVGGTGTTSSGLGGSALGVTGARARSLVALGLALVGAGLLFVGAGVGRRENRGR